MMPSFSYAAMRSAIAAAVVSSCAAKSAWERRASRWRSSSKGSMTVTRPLIAERNIHRARRGDHLAVGRDAAQVMDGVGDGHTGYLVILIADHLAEFVFLEELYGHDAEARTEDSVKRGGRAAALQMTEHAGARFLAGARGDLVGDHLAHAAEPRFANLGLLLVHLLSANGLGAFGHDNQGRKTAGVIT